MVTVDLPCGCVYGPEASARPHLIGDRVIECAVHDRKFLVSAKPQPTQYVVESFDELFKQG